MSDPQRRERTMTHEFKVNGKTYKVESERHGYRTRFYATEVDYAENYWFIHGYIGSYMPGSKTCGFQFPDGRKFNMSASGPKCAAGLCLYAFLNLLPVEVNY